MKNLRNIRTYSELIQLKTFEERFEYLKIGGTIGIETFGHDRYLNQKFYTSYEWRQFRKQIILRDNGCDLGIDGLDIYGPIFIHHINPINIEDLLENKIEFLLNPEYAICCSDLTHKTIHYSNADILPKGPIERTKYDTCPWKH